MKEQVRPAFTLAAERIPRLIADLDSEKFAVRERAQAELATLGHLPEAALRQTANSSESLEVRQRAEALLTSLDKQERLVLSPNMVRALRTVEALERIGTREARTVLESLAATETNSLLTADVKKALQRLAKRAPAKRP